MQNSEIVLIGGSGKTGGRIADRLEELLQELLHQYPR